MSSFRRAQAIRQTRAAARDLGRNLADLIAPQILDPRADPAAVAEVAKATIAGVTLAEELPNVPPELVAKIEADMHLAFWDRMKTHTRNLR